VDNLGPGLFAARRPAYTGQVIVECPNCQARYRLSEAVLAKGARLKCAACQHRWVPTAADQTPEPLPPPPKPKVLTEADEEAAFAAVQEQLLSRWAEPAPGAANVTPEPVIAVAGAPEAEDEPPPESSGLARTIVAVIAGLALGVIAAGLWLGRTDLASLPGIGPMLAGLESRSPLTLEVKGVVTQLPSSRRLLEVSGTIRNPGDSPATVAPLSATLAGPEGVALRWTIPAPVAVLPPRQQVAFSSTVTGFPAEAQALSVSLGR
jgi:predicted Zn finger-like uncharacterized protein